MTRSIFATARPAVLALASCLLAACTTVPGGPRDFGAAQSALSQHIRILASEEYGGREPGTEGGAKTEQYIADALQKAGFQPGAGVGKWLQPVTLVRYSPGTASLELVRDKARVGLSGDQLVATGRKREWKDLPAEYIAGSEGTLREDLLKGKAAVVRIENTSTYVDTGKPAFTTRFAAFIRGEGGFGESRGPEIPDPPKSPEREPDHVTTYTTRPDQALLYRLSGERNPLHSDPEIAKFAGFERPILHGLCTYGFTGRALLHTLCGSDVERFKSMDARFSKPVLPGDTLTVRMWVTEPGQAIFETVNQDGTVVITGGQFVYTP